VAPDRNQGATRRPNVRGCSSSVRPQGLSVSCATGQSRLCGRHCRQARRRGRRPSNWRTLQGSRSGDLPVPARCASAPTRTRAHARRGTHPRERMEHRGLLGAE
jgi:hypothetical protein